MSVKKKQKETYIDGQREKGGKEKLFTGINGKKTPVLSWHSVQLTGVGHSPHLDSFSMKSRISVICPQLEYQRLQKG